MVIKRTFILIVSYYLTDWSGLPLIILLLVYKQDIEIVDLPFGRNYSNLTLSVFDQKSGVTSKQTEESIFTELIDTAISTSNK